MNFDLIWLAASLTIWGIGEGMFLFFQPIYLQQLGADPVQIGFILGGVGIAMILAHLPAGYLADRFGRRKILILAWVIATIATWIMALSATLPLFVFGSALYGLTSFVAGPLNSYVTAARGHWSVGRALTMVSAAFNFGAVIGPLFGGWIAQNASLRNSFYLAGGLFTISFLVLLLTHPQPIESTGQQDPIRALSSVLSPRYLRYLFITFLAVFVMFLPQPLSQNFLLNERGISLFSIGILIASRSAGIVIINLFLGRRNARLGFILAQMIMAISTFLLWQGSGLLWYLPAYFLLGGYQTARSLAAAQGRAIVSSGSMGLAYGLLETVFALAAITAPPIAGLLYSSSPVSVYSVSLTGIILSVIAVFFWMPVKTQDLI